MGIQILKDTTGCTLTDSLQQEAAHPSHREQELTGYLSVKTLY
jgi:hypothetical protein